jgi:glucose-1-phosphate thymidylyltransferase
VENTSVPFVVVCAMKAAILARGLATRMRAAAEAPLDAAQAAAAAAGLKTLMPIRGRPFLDYALSRLADAGARDVALVIGPDQDDPVRARYDRTAPPARVRVTFVVAFSSWLFHF